MGFMIILEFVVRSFYVVPWTLFALVYPLYASIRAIETDSSADFRKLVAYWILFSLTFLFEGAFVKLLEWLPLLWPYIKLVIFCWLVLSNFDGAFYVYKHLLHPCISLDVKDLINQFKEKKEFFFNRIKVVTVKKRYVKEIGDEALHEIVANKSKGSEHINFVQKDTNAPEVTEKKEVATAEQVSLTEPGLAHFKIKKFEPEEIKGTSEKVAASSEFAETPVSKNVQQDWTFGVCQVTILVDQCIYMIMSYPCSFMQSKCGEPINVVQKDMKAVEVAEKTDMATAKQVSLPEFCFLPSENKKFEPEEIKRISATAAARSEVPEIPVSKNVQQEWTCSVCQFTAHSEAVLKSHLQGRRHRSREEQLKAKNQPSKSKVSPAPEDKKSEDGEVPTQKPLQVQQDYLTNKWVELKESLWCCTLCNVSCTNMDIMFGHLNGKKHLARIRQSNGLVDGHTAFEQ
ncbi:hypothetical protein Pint_23388 [Pistacia integerrima]|uniref:Uncharacterized protein n=1 Tax=Pistacia integerrima TaxID=434235 RepID=A0ACC0YJY1_9ROSI|nr:hypothetical protein Pint_23388 [Pistacia integerrima]